MDVDIRCCIGVYENVVVVVEVAMVGNWLLAKSGVLLVVVVVVGWCEETAVADAVPPSAVTAEDDALEISTV